MGNKLGKIDYVYTGLFHISILPPVYINLFFLLPWLRKTNNWIAYALLTLSSIALFSWLNLSFFSDWSNTVLPDYFFISYFNFLQITLFFIVYICISSLLKLSKSWFIVKELQGELLEAEKEKSLHEKALLELEAKALRAQMNPHFVFNCLNSIKALMQEQQTEKGVIYLTTFSKLIRTLFNNADKKEITLYDEMETCKLYLQLEAMRFDTKFSYAVNVEDSIDLKSVQVPALIIQPFIENAIWHGIMPKIGEGNVLVNVAKKNGHIEIAIEDDGIGREASHQNKSINMTHQSKGVNLTQARLELDNLLQQRQASLVTIDKKDENGKATGTKVIITIKEEI
ncbi:MAG: histidine kinase [Chitinophagaceae bacterium]|nr:histidine kinase [Chitinophagaceae bacterium]